MTKNNTQKKNNKERPKKKYDLWAYIVWGLAGALTGYVVALEFHRAQIEKAITSKGEGTEAAIKNFSTNAQSLEHMKKLYAEDLRILTELRDDVKSKFIDRLWTATPEGDVERRIVKINTGILCLRSERQLETERKFTTTGIRTFSEGLNSVIVTILSRLSSAAKSTVTVIVLNKSKKPRTITNFNV